MKAALASAQGPRNAGQGVAGEEGGARAAAEGGVELAHVHVEGAPDADEDDLVAGGGIGGSRGKAATAPVRVCPCRHLHHRGGEEAAAAKAALAAQGGAKELDVAPVVPPK